MFSKKTKKTQNKKATKQTQKTKRILNNPYEYYDSDVQYITQTKSVFKNKLQAKMEFKCQSTNNKKTKNKSELEL